LTARRGVTYIFVTGYGTGYEKHAR
jgi:hypothetical protein